MVWRLAVPFLAKEKGSAHTVCDRAELVCPHNRPRWRWEGGSDEGDGREEEGRGSRDGGEQEEDEVGSEMSETMIEK